MNRLLSLYMCILTCILLSIQIFILTKKVTTLTATSNSYKKQLNLMDIQAAVAETDLKRCSELAVGLYSNYKGVRISCLNSTMYVFTETSNRFKDHTYPIVHKILNL